MFQNFNNMEEWVDDGMKELAIETMYLAKRYAPEDTMRLMKDIKYGRNGPNDWYVTADPVDKYGTHYAVYNEYGSIRTPAGTPESPIASVSANGKYCFRPFMRTAAYQIQQNASEIVLSKIFKRY